MADAYLYGMPVHERDYLTPGKLVVTEGTVFMHPLDRIWLEHPGRPLTRLEKAMAWCVEDACRKADEKILALRVASLLDRAESEALLMAEHYAVPQRFILGADQSAEHFAWPDLPVEPSCPPLCPCEGTCDFYGGRCVTCLHQAPDEAAP